MTLNWLCRITVTHMTCLSNFVKWGFTVIIISLFNKLPIQSCNRWCPFMKSFVWFGFTVFVISLIIKIDDLWFISAVSDVFKIPFIWSVKSVCSFMSVFAKHFSSCAKLWQFESNTFEKKKHLTWLSWKMNEKKEIFVFSETLIIGLF